MNAQECTIEWNSSEWNPKALHELIPKECHECTRVHKSSEWNPRARSGGSNMRSPTVGACNHPDYCRKLPPLKVWLEPSFHEFIPEGRT